MLGSFDPPMIVVRKIFVTSTTGAGNDQNMYRTGTFTPAVVTAAPRQIFLKVSLLPASGRRTDSALVLGGGPDPAGAAMLLLSLRGVFVVIRRTRLI